MSDTVPVAARPKNEPLTESVSVTVDPKWSTAVPENLPALIARVPKWNCGAVLPAPGVQVSSYEMTRPSTDSPFAETRKWRGYPGPEVPL